MRGLQEVNDAVIDSVRAVYPRNDRATCLILLRCEFEWPVRPSSVAGERLACRQRCGAPSIMGAVVGVLGVATVALVAGAAIAAESSKTGCLSECTPRIGIVSHVRKPTSYLPPPKKNGATG